MLSRVDPRRLLGHRYVGDIDLVLLEQEIILQSTLFVGNEASGISKWIIARRRAAGDVSLAVAAVESGYGRT